MKSNPLVTIITPSYNQGRFVEETIKSVLNQSYSPIEYIFVDGDSTDNTMQIVEKYVDKIHIIINEKDKGQADAINKGFKLAKGGLVGWVNSDDILYPDCVERIVELYKQKNNAAIYYHSYNDIIDEFGNLLKSYQQIIPSRRHLLRYNYDVVQQGSFYNRKYLDQVGYLDIDNYYCMDLDLWLKLSMHGEIVYSEDNPHSAFRIYEGTKTYTGKENFINNIHSVLKKHGAKIYYPSIWHRIYVYKFKIKLKRFFNK